KVEPVKIILKPGTTPYRAKQQTFATKELEDIRIEIQRMLDSGIIKHSRSPWASRLRAVYKPDGSLRVCGNFIPLNERTVPDSFPLPDIPTILDWVGNFRFKATLDLEKGFWQVP